MSRGGKAHVLLASLLWGDGPLPPTSELLVHGEGESGLQDQPCILLGPLQQ